MADGWRLFWRTVGVFAYRDLTIQYRTLYRGLAWFLVQQALYVGLFAVFLEGIFGRGRTAEAGAAPYWLYVYSGIVIWQFFAKAISRAMTSLIDQRAILSRVRVSVPAIPVAAVAACTVELAVSLIMLAIALAATGAGHVDLAGTVTGILALLLFCICTAAIGMLLAVANVWIEELRHVFPVLLQLWFFLTPVVYFPDAAPEALRWVFTINPVSEFLDVFRNVVLSSGHVTGSFGSFALCGAAYVLVSAAISYLAFREASLSDRL
jgi:ABC-2 type transport system permease protein/lipopolysaccharide transport system permease protein